MTGFAGWRRRTLIHVVTPGSVASAASLDISSVPRALLWRGLALLPFRQWGSRLFWRMVFEQSLPRYLIALIPFPIAMILRPDLALPIAQAPLFMFALVYIVETRVLTVDSPERRRALMDKAGVERMDDAFAVRARGVLTRLLAARDQREGRFHLVVEQSPLVKVAPLTLVSVQSETPAGVLELSGDERALLRDALFDDGLAEEDLHLAMVASNTFLRSADLDAGAISGHARLAAMAQARSRAAG